MIEYHIKDGGKKQIGLGQWITNCSFWILENALVLKMILHQFQRLINHWGTLLEHTCYVHRNQPLQGQLSATSSLPGSLSALRLCPSLLGLSPFCFFISGGVGCLKA